MSVPFVNVTIFRLNKKRLASELLFDIWVVVKYESASDSSNFALFQARVVQKPHLFALHIPTQLHYSRE